MNKFASVTLLAIGPILIGFGLSEADSLGVDFSRFFTSAPIHKSVWMLISGSVATIIGISWLTRGLDGVRSHDRPPHALSAPPLSAPVGTLPTSSVHQSN